MTNIIHVPTGEIVGRLIKNHSMTMDEICNLCDIPVMRTEEDYICGEKYFIEDLIEKEEE